MNMDALIHNQLNDIMKEMDLPRKEQAFFRDLWYTLQPTRLLKVGRGGRLMEKTRYRLFYISPELHSLVWNSGKNQRSLTMSSVKELRFGMKTDKFTRAGLKAQDKLCFSIIYNSGKNPLETLDIVCQNDKEVVRWTNVLENLIEGKISTKAKDVIKAKITKHFVFDASVTLDDKDAQIELNVDKLEAYAMGWGQWGQNGVGPDFAQDISEPRLLAEVPGNLSSVACGWSHTIMQLENGGQDTVLQFGSSLGTHEEYDVFSPTPLSALPRVKIANVACGSFHSTALTADGLILTWGSNAHGQLGHGDKVDTKEPRRVENIPAVEHVCCGANFTGAVDEAGRVYTWGSNMYGQLGHNDTNERLEPTVIADLIGTDVKGAAAGDYHMFAMTENGLYAWGLNGCGQLGVGGEEVHSRPTLVDSLRGSSVQMIACGAAHSIAIVNNINEGVVYVWGSNACGQLGLDTQLQEAFPTPVTQPRLPAMVSVACGSMHTMLLTADGEVWCAGFNQHGQLGSGGRKNIEQFRAVNFFQDEGKRIIAMACGGQNTVLLTIRKDGTQDPNSKHRKQPS